MKKFIAVLLVAMMVIPFGLFVGATGETNVAQGKSYTIAGVHEDHPGYGDGTLKKLTDGKKPAKSADFNLKYSTKDSPGAASDNPQWASLNGAGKDGKLLNPDAGEGVAKIYETSVTLDLGEDFSKLKTAKFYALLSADGIGLPSSVEVKVGASASSLTSIGKVLKANAVQEVKSSDDAAKAQFGLYSYSVTVAEGFSARYVKFVVEQGAGWVFASEVEVYQDSTLPDAPVAVSQSLIGTAADWKSGEPVQDQTITASQNGDGIKLSGSTKAWPHAYLDLATPLTFDKNGDLELVYDITVEGAETAKANIVLFADGATVGKNDGFPLIRLTHYMADDATRGSTADLVADDLPVGTYKGRIKLSDLKTVKIDNSENKNVSVDVPLADPAKLPISAVKVFSVGGATVFVNKLAVETKKEMEKITVDGIVDDNGWAKDKWTRVDSTTGRWQGDLAEGETRGENYDFQFRTDDTMLYGAIKVNVKPMATADQTGNGKGSNIRLWLKNPNAQLPKDATDATLTAPTVYTHFIDIAYKLDSDPVVSTRKNTLATVNKANDVATDPFVIDGMVVKAVAGSDSWIVEFALPFAALGATDKLDVYTTYSAPKSYKADGTPEGNNALLYGPYAGEKLTGTPYMNWDEAHDINLIFADIKLGEIKGGGGTPVNPGKPAYPNIMGDEKSNPGFLLNLTADKATYKPGEIITVTLTLKNVTAEHGLNLLMAKLVYDDSKVDPVLKNTFVTDVNGNTGVKDMSEPLKTSPTGWTEHITRLYNAEDVAKALEEDPNFLAHPHYSINHGTTGTGAENLAKADGSVVLEFAFKVLDDATGPIRFQLPHAYVQGTDVDMNGVEGNGTLLDINAAAKTPDSSSSSSTSSGGNGGQTGDTGLIMLAIVAVVSFAGASAVVTRKKRS